MAQQDADKNEAQARFNRTYITATEIARDLDVSRTAVLRAKIRGLLPESVTVGDGYVTIWEREKVREPLEAWRRIISCRKAHAA